MISVENVKNALKKKSILFDEYMMRRRTQLTSTRRLSSTRKFELNQLC